MTLMRRPQRHLSSARDVAGWLADDPWRLFDRLAAQQEVQSLPAIDLRETDDRYVVTAEMPGIKPDDAEVTIDGNTLVIRGQYGEERDEEREGGRWLIRERRTGSFARAIMLPTDVDAEAIVARFEDGELTLDLPKAQTKRAHRIQIAGAGQQARSVGEGEGTSGKTES